MSIKFIGRLAILNSKQTDTFFFKHLSIDFLVTIDIVCLIGFYVTSTQYRSYFDVLAFTGGGRPQVPYLALFESRPIDVP
jgi:hypothetical protein